LPRGGGGVSARSWLTGGALPSTLLWVDKFWSWSRRDAAKDCMAAWRSRADHLEMRAAMTGWRSAGACLALDWASNRMKFVVSWLQRPPVSKARTTSLQRLDWRNSG